MPPPTLLRASVLLAALVIALATTGKASAGCGDHVVILKAAGLAKADDSSHESSVPKPPCRGPHCSANPSQPAAPPISTGAVVSVTAEEVFTPVGSPDTDDLSSLCRPFEFLSSGPIDRASSIFHPPRA